MNDYKLGCRARPLLTRRNSVIIRGILLILICGCAFALGSPALASDPRGSADGPTILKNTIRVNVWQLSGAWSPGASSPDFKYNSWFPRIDFRVLGPVPGGSQFQVDFTRPDGSAWATVNLPTQEIHEQAFYGNPVSGLVVGP